MLLSVRDNYTMSSTPQGTDDRQGLRIITEYEYRLDILVPSQTASCILPAYIASTRANLSAVCCLSAAGHVSRIHTGIEYVFCIQAECRTHLFHFFNEAFNRPKLLLVRLIAEVGTTQVVELKLHTFRRQVLINYLEPFMRRASSADTQYHEPESRLRLQVNCSSLIVSNASSPLFQNSNSSPE